MGSGRGRGGGVMTGQRTGLRAAEAEDVKRHNTRLVVEALKKDSEAVRVVCDIRQWVGYEQHLIDTCTTPECADCATRRSMLASLSRLLPAVPERRAESGEEVTRDGDASDQAGPRDGLTPDR